MDKSIKVRTQQELAKEIRDRMTYKYLLMDGTIDFPNSYEGDVLRMTSHFIKAYLREENANV